MDWYRIVWVSSTLYRVSSIASLGRRLPARRRRKNTAGPLEWRTAYLLYNLRYSNKPARRGANVRPAARCWQNCKRPIVRKGSVGLLSGRFYSQRENTHLVKWEQAPQKVRTIRLTIFENEALKKLRTRRKAASRNHRQERNFLSHYDAAERRVRSLARIPSQSNEVVTCRTK